MPAPIVNVHVNIDIEEGKEDSGVGTKTTDKNGPLVLAEAEWVSMEIKNLLGSAPIQIKDAYIDYGKFYDGGDKNRELSTSQIDQIVIAPSQTGVVSACGREGTMTGTNGNISLYDSSTKICVLNWEVPYWSSTNSFSVDSVNPAYSVTVGDWNYSSGAIGNVYIEVESLPA